MGNRSNLDNLLIRDEQIEQINSFKYSGAIVNGNNLIEEDIKARIIFGNKAYYGNLDLFKCKLLI